MSNKKYRICFARASKAEYPVKVFFGHAFSSSLGADSSIQHYLESRHLVGNIGNIVHRQSLTDLLCYDRENSIELNLIELLKKYNINDIVDFINDNFDILIFTFSNDLRNGVNDFGLTPLVKLIKIKIFVFGLGGEMYENLNISKSLFNLLSAFNDKASIFSVRGYLIEKYLKSFGFDRVIALGCPSLMYVSRIAKLFNYNYHEKIIDFIDNKYINKQKFEGGGRILTSGRLVPFTSMQNRTALLIKGFILNNEYKQIKLDYIFQEELIHYSNLNKKSGVYNHATGELSSKMIKNYLEPSILPIPFSKFYFFSDIGSWRTFTTKYDLFIGDRIHGGVIACQSGIPSIFLYADDRVKELCHYHGLPSMTLRTFSLLGIKKSVELLLERNKFLNMLPRLNRVYTKFIDILKYNDIEIVN